MQEYDTDLVSLRELASFLLRYYFLRIPFPALYPSVIIVYI